MIESYKEKKKAYLKAVNEKKEQDAEIADMKAQIASIDEPYHKPDEIMALKKEIGDCEKAKDNTSAVCTQMEIMVRDAKELLEKLDKPICPLSDKICCTVDKTPISKDYEAELKASESLLGKQKKLLADQETKLFDLKEKLERFSRDNISAEKRNVLQARLNKVLSQPVVIPEEPKDPGDADTFAKEYNELLVLYTAARDYEKAASAKEQLKKNTELYEKYDTAIAWFAPKGVVREAIVKHYVALLEKRCNTKISEVNDALKIRFRVANGVRLEVSPNGDGLYTDLDMASGGERAVILYAVMDMLNALSGFKILIMDELSVLDKDAFERLLGIIIKNKDEYDHVFIAASEHIDIKDALEDQCVKELKL